MAVFLIVGAPRIELGPHVPKTCILPIYYAPVDKYPATIAVVRHKDNSWKVLRDFQRIRLSSISTLACFWVSLI